MAKRKNGKTLLLLRKISNAYLNHLRKLDVHLNEKNGIGLGTNLHINGSSVSGDILKLDDDIIHFYSFPKQRLINAN